MRIEPETYRDLIATMPGADPDDHVHSAAAVAATLRKVVEATGGELQLVVRCPDQGALSLVIDV